MSAGPASPRDIPDAMSVEEADGIEEYVEDIVTGRGGIYEKRMGVPVGEDYTVAYRSASPSPRGADGQSGSVPAERAQPSGEQQSDPDAEKHDPDVDEYVDGILTGRGGIYEKRMGIGLEDDYTAGYAAPPGGNPSGSEGQPIPREPSASSGGEAVGGASTSQEVHPSGAPSGAVVSGGVGEVAEQRDPHDPDVDDYVDGILTGRGGIYEKRMGIGLEDDYTAGYAAPPGGNPSGSEGQPIPREPSASSGGEAVGGASTSQEVHPSGAPSGAVVSGGVGEVAEQRDPHDPDVDDYVDGILTGRGGIYEKRMGIGLDDDYTAGYQRRGDSSGRVDMPETPSEAREHSLSTSVHPIPCEGAAQQAGGAGHGGENDAPQERADPHDPDVDDYVDGILTGRGGIYEKRMGIGLDDDYTAGYQRRGDSGRFEMPETDPDRDYDTPPEEGNANRRAAAAAAAAASPPRAHHGAGAGQPAAGWVDPKDKDVEDYVDGLLTGRGGIYEKRMGIGLDDDYTAGYQRRGDSGRFEMPEADPDRDYDSSGDEGMHRRTAAARHDPTDPDVEDYVDGLLTGRGGIYEKQMGIPLEEDYTKGFRGGSRGAGGGKGERRDPHDPDVDDYADGIVTGRGGIYEKRMGCRPGDDWAAEYLRRSGGDAHYLRSPGTDSFLSSDLGSSGKAGWDGGGFAETSLLSDGSLVYGLCGTERRSPDDIKITVKIRGENMSKAFYLNVETSFKGLRNAVTHKLGRISALCYRDSDMDMDVEVDDDESLSLFLEQGGSYKLVGLRDEASHSSDAVMRQQLNWGAHDCHSVFAEATKSLPPVDIRSAPHTTRAPLLAQHCRADTGYRQRLLDERDNQFQKDSERSIWKQRRRSQHGTLSPQYGSRSMGGGSASRGESRRVSAAFALPNADQRRPSGHIPPRRGTLGDPADAGPRGRAFSAYARQEQDYVHGVFDDYDDQSTAAFPVEGRGTGQQRQAHLDTNFSIPQAYSEFEPTEGDMQTEGERMRPPPSGPVLNL